MQLKFSAIDRFFNDNVYKCILQPWHDAVRTDATPVAVSLWSPLHCSLSPPFEDVVDGHVSTIFAI